MSPETGLITPYSLLMTYKYFTKTVFFIGCTILGFSNLKAQEKENAITSMVKGKEYTFTAQSYTSTTVSQRQLTDDYSVRIKSDSVIGLLPYYGQSYSAQINVTDGGLKFSSAKFDYSVVEKKKGKCEITIRPKDDRTVQLLFMTVFSDGSAQLQVSSTNREAMTFYGYVSVR
jgi:hypothetical protein